jgi:diguanylate cyclase (GGDEF)-like protein
MAKNQEAAINRQIGRLLRQGSIDRDEFEAKVAELAAQYGDEVYCALLYSAAHLEFGKRAAKNHFQKVLQHWNSLCADTRRDVDFRVALLDYFLTTNRCIRNPKIIEVKIFEKTRQETEIDDLTQLHNFRYFSKAIELEVCRSTRYHAPLSLVLFDADDFKFYNDTNGHLAGNKALKKLAGIIKKSVREVDIAARFGGEEFALLLPETNKEGAFTIADRICRAVERAAFPNGKRQPRKRFTVSGGIATLHVDAKDASTLIKKADQALYRAKARGKNQVALYIDELREYERVSTAIMGKLSVSSDSGDLILLQDVSEGGMLFRYDKALPVAAVCKLDFSLPGVQKPISCKVKVRRVEELEGEGQYATGASLVQIKPGDKKKLKAFIRSMADLNIEPKKARKETQ